MLVITGAAGFIGSCLAQRFNELGRGDLLLVDHLGLGAAKRPNLTKRKYSDYFERDDFIRDLEKGRLNGKIEAILHIGACTDTTETNKEYLWDVNLRYSTRLAQWCLAHGKRFLYASSGATYGDGTQGYSDEDSNSFLLKPLNLYGMSKHLFDLWVLENKLERKFVGWKLFNVYGPNEYHKGNMRSVAHKGYGQAKSEGKIRLFKSHKPEYADGEQKRDFVYVKDVVDVMIWFWNHPAVAGIFNLATGQAQTWNELGRAIFASLGQKGEIEYIEMPDSIRDRYQYYTQADLTKLRGAGCQQKFMSIEEGLRDYIQKHLETADPYL